MLGFDIIINWDTESKRDEPRHGEQPFRYPNTFLLLLDYTKVYFHLSYRQTKGVITKGHVKGKLFADGAYDSNEIFRNLGDNGIQTCLKVRKNARVRWKKGSILSIV